MCWCPATAGSAASAFTCLPRRHRDPDEVQQGQVQGPLPGEEQSLPPVQAWGGPAGEQLCGEGPGCPGGQVDHEPAVCPFCQEGQWYSGMH